MTDHTPAAQAAIQEGERIAAADEYFAARTWIMDTNDNRRIFEAGFDRAYALLSKLRRPCSREALEALDYLVAQAKSAASHWHVDQRAALVRSALASAPVTGNAVCKGSMALGSGCGKCERCRAELASAPVAGEAQPVIHQHGFAADNQRLRAINESLDKQLEEVMTERDDYHDMADKLANAIADHLLVEIGEHSSSNCPWMRALDAIQDAAPQASEASAPGHKPIDTSPGHSAAPQASEAVRDAGIAASEDVVLPPPSHRHPMSGEPIWDERTVRTALSAQPSGNPGELAAQPGAQKEQSDA